MKGNRKQWYL